MRSGAQRMPLIHPSTVASQSVARRLSLFALLGARLPVRHDRIKMRHSQCLGEFIERHDCRIPLTLLQPGQILLAEA